MATKSGHLICTLPPVTPLSSWYLASRIFTPRGLRLHPALNKPSEKSTRPKSKFSRSFFLVPVCLINGCLGLQMACGVPNDSPTHLDAGFGTVLTHTHTTDILRIFIRNLHVLPYSQKKGRMYISSNILRPSINYYYGVRTHPAFKHFYSWEIAKKNFKPNNHWKKK